MTMTNFKAVKTITGTICFGVALSTMTACGSAGPGDGENSAFLSLVSDRNVYLDNGDTYDVQVRYHDSDQEPLAGVVNFAIDGDAAGATLTSSSATTDSDGVATVTLDADADEQAQFFIEATAPDAGAASYNITIEKPQEPLEPNGTYEVRSTYDLVSGLEDGDVADVVFTIRDFAEDPAGALVDLLIDVCGDESFCDPLVDNRDTIAGLLDAALKSYAPDLVQEILEHGENLVQVTENFRIVSELSIEGREGSRSAEHLLTGVDLVYGNERIAVTLGEMNLEDIEAKSVAFSMPEPDEIELGEHAMPISYGTLLLIAVERVVIANVANNIDNIPNGINTIPDLLDSVIDCESLGQDIDEALPGDFEAGETLCNFLVDQGADQIVDLIKGIDDTGAEIVVSGTGEPVSTNGDNIPNVIRNGRWDGSLEYGGSVSATLSPDDNTFEAERIGE